jgi:hypothetical protein
MLSERVSRLNGAGLVNDYKLSKGLQQLTILQLLLCLYLDDKLRP